MKTRIFRYVTELLLSMVMNNVYAQLPSVTVKDLEGRVVRCDTLSNDGKPFVIDFFATWCKPCNRELDAIREVYEDWREETGVKIYAISIDQGQNIHKVKPLVESHCWEYDVLLDANGDLRQALNVQMIPFVLICDPNGKVVYQHQGYTEGEEDELIEFVRKMVLSSSEAYPEK